MNAKSPTQRVESEISKHQRNLVDLCLEEGQYESAIDVLAQLRSPNHKPSATHIRQLLFMALYSSSDRGQDKRVDPSASPSKRQKKSHLLPSLAATLASQQLLISFVTTNSPAAVIRPLRPGDPELEDDNECFVATESMCISRCKNCWQILVEGFLDRNQPILSTPKGKGKRRDVDASFTDLSEVRAPVGDTAWPVLDWLLLLFERDERENPTLPRHSPLLLEQLGSQSRRDTDAPLAIILHCMQQSDLRRRMMGSRLISLLINLSSTTHLDFPMLVVSVFNCLSTSSLDDISSLLSNLSPTPAVSKFKVALYQKYFSDSSNAPRVGVRPKPQARAQPKGSPVKLPDPPAQPVSLVNKHRAPSSAEILRLMGSKPSTSVNPTASPFRIKFELLVSYNAFQTGAAKADGDPEWPNLLRDGTMAKTLDTAFGCKGEPAGDGTNYRILLDTILTM
ncbi:hypothetical protein B0H17DRAFT_1074483 [Mycena rosella]|uniref:Uncharacterized protein n=1 Tax=Mycena rosella TaxID=1033263 RepID=A0AAD7D7H8_MYCRO|nr:hypothetical protein B0H17DRAFT_1074483 [Mycena rosella]